MKPTFVLSKSERRGAGNDLDTRYRKAWVGRFAWEGLEAFPGCPSDRIEKILFDHSGVGVKKVKGLGLVLLPAQAVGYTLYDRPAAWLPANIHPTDVQGNPIGALFEPSDEPVLWQDHIPAEVIEPYLEIQRRAVSALNQNMAGLAMPILVETQPGANLNFRLIEQNLGSGKCFIQVIDRGTMPAEVLDLHAQDHSQNLISVIHDTDSTILDILHIRAAMEKASGISDLETSASDEQLNQGLEHDLRIRREWVDLVNDRFGLSLGVKIVKSEKEKDNDEPENTGKDDKDE